MLHACLFPYGAFLPAGGNEDDHRDNDRAADRRTGRDRNLVHVGRWRGYGAHLPALGVRHGVGRYVDLLE